MRHARLALVCSALVTSPATAQAWMCDVATEGDTALLNIQLVEVYGETIGAGYVALLTPQSGRPIDWGAEAEFLVTQDGFDIRPTSNLPEAPSFQAWLHAGDLVKLHDPYGALWEGTCEKWDYPE
ncbi:MAG: hypothetical protein MRY64_11580 [Hyphomonadaceae bacterium]|nr:hypothetical protein [Hyphomonadaceae bacterium]